MSARIHVITASAGTGKTYRLSTYLKERLLAPSGGPRPEAVLAITYTRKAAAELRSRLRRRLMEEGRADLAGRIRDGYVGTVHSVCQRLLSENALQVGWSPELTPVPDSEERRIFQGALEEIIKGAPGAAALYDAAERMGLRPWHAHVRDVVEQARINGLVPADVRSGGGRSLEGMLDILPAAVGDAARRDAELIEALETLVDDLDAYAGANKTARAKAERASSLLAALNGGRARWSELLAVSKAAGSVKRHEEAAAAFTYEVGRHRSHPRLREDLTRVIRGVTDAAAGVLDRFAEAKRAARVVDYGDMLTGALELLQDPVVAEELAERLDLVLVDEFQDTSPIQLALISALTEAAGEAAWVGDRKQSIFGFQGADPDLMDAAARGALQGQHAEVLSGSWRSRPGVVRLSSEVFAAGLAAHGFDEGEVRVTAIKPDPAELSDEACLEVWRADGGNWDALAEGVRATLARGALVRGWRAGEPEDVRPARPGDVAVLCRSNDHCRRVAGALGGVGVPASVALPGLFGTPEGVLARAALAVLADPRDSLASAIVSWLTGGAGDDPDAWLAARLEAVEAARLAGGRLAPFADDPAVQALRGCLEGAERLSPTEALDAAMEAVGLREVCLTWSRPDERVANLEAMRSAAREYEALCEARRSACTVAGLAAHLDELPEDDDSAQRAAPTAADVVQVMTFHKAKGLEWPITVLTSLDSAPRSSAFGVVAEPAAVFDAAAPLNGRWVRYWPWPYGDQKKGADLSNDAMASEAGQAAERRELRERARLLYVGFTRARDKLVLFAKAGKNGVSTRWLDELRSVAEAPALVVPWDGDGDAIAQAADVDIPCVVRRLGPPDEPVAPPRVGAPALGPISPTPAMRPPESVRPSEAGEIAGATVGEVIRLGPRPALAAKGHEIRPLGDAVHAYLAGADRSEAAAASHLTANGVAHALTPIALVRIGVALDKALEFRWPDATRQPEWPVRWRRPSAEGARLVVGEIDLVLDDPGGLVVVDHKAYPGDVAGRDERVRKYAGQLRAYREALAAATGRPAEEAWLHFPLLGELVRVDLP